MNNEWLMIEVEVKTYWCSRKQRSRWRGRLPQSKQAGYCYWGYTYCSDLAQSLGRGPAQPVRAAVHPLVALVGVQVGCPPRGVWSWSCLVDHIWHGDWWPTPRRSCSRRWRCWRRCPGRASCRWTASSCRTPHHPTGPPGSWTRSPARSCLH